MFSRSEVRNRRNSGRSTRALLAVIVTSACAVATLVVPPGAVPEAHAAAAPPAAAFTLGAVDQSDAEFALDPAGYANYSTTFPNDVAFTVGTSTAASNWSYIQPGPGDAWAGSKVHPFTINYSLAAVPKSDLVLQVSYLDNHPSTTTATKVEVGSNGSVAATATLAPGAGVGYRTVTGGKSQRVNFVIPASTLRVGANSLVLKNTTGFWTVFDAINLASTVFTVGTADKSDADLGLAPAGYADYSTTFPNDVNFTIGTSVRGDWSYIQPGPADSWAGSKVHPFTINYSLAAVPAGDLMLELHYFDSPAKAKPQGTVEVKSNTAVPIPATVAYGAGSGYNTATGVEQRLDIRIPRSTLKAGSNSLVITNTVGSWTIWDAVGLAPVSSATPPRPDHVVIVNMENKGYTDIIGSPSAPYTNSLANGGASFTDTHAVFHPSLPNYYATLSGGTQGLTSSTPLTSYSINADNIAHQLQAAGLTFSSWSDQSLPSNWMRFVNLKPAGGDTAVNTTVDRSMTAFPTDFTKLPTVSFAVGDEITSGHSGATLAEQIKNGDDWIRTKFGPFAEWAKTHNSLLIVTWDEDNFTPINHIPTIFYGQHVKTGQYSETINQYGLLRTIQDMYGLQPLNQAATAAPITDAWN